MLILREVLGFSAKEVAETLDTTTASVNSALQRARRAAEERLPERSQQETLRSLGEDGVREVVESYVDAWDRGDIDGVVAMLTEDAAFSMPPMRRWFRGHDDIEGFLRFSPLSGRFQWKAMNAHANGQPALAFYSWDDEQGAYMPFALNVLTLRDARISEVTAFIVRPSEDPDDEAQQALPELPFDPDRLAAAYEPFGLPTRLD